MVELGVPIRELQELPLLGRARRLKTSFSSEQMAGFKDFRAEIDRVFNGIRLEYAKGEHA
jgi:V/A-type H+-transporting ATPase subunit A